MSRLTARGVHRSLIRCNWIVPPRRLLSNSGTDNNSAPSMNVVTSVQPSTLTPPAQIQRAIEDLHSIPELKQALTTNDASLRSTLLSRIFDILTPASTSSSPSPSAPSNPGSGSPHAVVAHSLLARQAHITGDVPVERSHRVHALTHLSALDVRTEDEVSSLRSALAAANLALSLCCLRSRGAEMRLASASSAATAEALSTHSSTRMCSTLLSALSAGSAQKRGMLLTALTAIDARGEQPDSAGFARYFIATDALRTGDHETALDQSLALVTRWDFEISTDSEHSTAPVSTYDVVEALVLAADACDRARGGDQAEDLLRKALSEIERVGGNKVDKCEPLLGLAKLYIGRNAVIQAEGMFRAAEDAFEQIWKQKAFTIASAHVYVRVLEGFADMLEKVTVNGVQRRTEVEEKRFKIQQIKGMFPYIMPPVVEQDAESTSAIPPWVVDSLISHFDLPLPI